MMEMEVTTGATRLAKLQSNRHHQQTNTQTGWPSCHPTNIVKALKGNYINSIIIIVIIIISQTQAIGLISCQDPQQVSKSEYF